MDKRTVRIQVRFSESEGYALQQICDEYNVNLSVLLRECTFSDFTEEQVKVKFNDLFYYGQTINNTTKAVESIIRKVEESKMYSSELLKIKMTLTDTNAFYISNYRKIQNVRKRIERAVISDIRKNKDTYFEKYVEPKLNNKNNGDKMNKDTMIRLTEDEYRILKELTFKENTSMSTLLKNNVFKKCVSKRSVVNSYPLDTYSQAIDEKTKILLAIAGKAEITILNERDINNVLSILENIKDINVELDKSILTEQKDIRREVKKILKERRES